MLKTGLTLVPRKEWIIVAIIIAVYLAAKYYCSNRRDIGKPPLITFPPMKPSSLLPANSCRIMICTPAYGGKMDSPFVLSLLRLVEALKYHDFHCEYQFLSNESLISRARNTLAHQFLHSTCDWLLFLDADISFDADDILHMARCAIQNPDIRLIGGVYPKKEIDQEKLSKSGKLLNIWNYVVCPFEESRLGSREPVKVKYIGAGLMLIHRSVFADMQKAFPQDVYTMFGIHYFKYFDCIIKDIVYLSEDYYFCERYQQTGGTVYAMYFPKVQHWGTFAFGLNIE